jgi:probable rRNA maturation factor
MMQIHSGFPTFENMQRIQLFFNDVKAPLQNRKELKLFLASIFIRESKNLEELNIVFCTDKFLLKMNQAFLSHDYFTDIITFPLSKKNEPVKAELYISLDRVRANAKSHDIYLKQELHRVIFHGCLHLCGYGDKSSQQIKKMREREDYYLRLYFSK